MMENVGQRTWQKLLQQSFSLQAEAESLRSNGETKAADELWRRSISPLNARIQKLGLLRPPRDEGVSS